MRTAFLLAVTPLIMALAGSDEAIRKLDEMIFTTAAISKCDPVLNPVTADQAKSVGDAARDAFLTELNGKDPKNLGNAAAADSMLREHVAQTVAAVERELSGKSCNDPGVNARIGRALRR